MISAHVTTRRPTGPPRRTPLLPSTTVEADGLLCRLAVLRHGLVLPLARAAGALAALAAWPPFGYHAAEDLMREHFRRSARWFRDLVRLHEAVVRLPALGRALAGVDGGPALGQKAALVISRVAQVEDAATWIARARRLSLAELRRAVAAHAEGDGDASDAPGSPTSAPLGSQELDDQNSHQHLPRRGIAPDEAEPGEVRVPLVLHGPPEVRLTFDAVQELHQAVVGREPGLVAFVESLVGEAASAGWVPPEDLHVPLVERFTRAARAQTQGPSGRQPLGSSHRRVMDGRAVDLPAAQATPVVTPSTPAGRRALATLQDFALHQARLGRLARKLEKKAPLSRPASRTRARDLKRLGAVLARLVRFENAVEIAMADLLLELHERSAWGSLGYAGLEAYAEERLGLGRSTARRRVELARRLRQFPALREAYRTGRLGEEAALWVSRQLAQLPVHSRDQEAWIAYASGTMVKRLRDEQKLLQREKLLRQVAVARSMTRRKGEVPRRSPGGAGAAAAGTARRVPALEPVGAPEAGAPGTSAPGADSGQQPQIVPVSDETWQTSLLRIPGRTRAWVFALGHDLLERLALGGPLTEAPVKLALPPEPAADFMACIEAARRDLEARSASPLSPAEESRSRPSARMAREFAQGEQRVPSWLGLLAWLEEAVWTWDDPRSVPRREYDPAYRRDSYRCMAPGCTGRAFLQAHHLHYRGRGGPEDLWNLLVLCPMHHKQGEHGMFARCWGRAPLDVVWRLGLPELATWWRNERRLDPGAMASRPAPRPQPSAQLTDAGLEPPGWITPSGLPH